MYNIRGKELKVVKGINTFTLKMIAIASMLIDHIRAVLFPQITIFRMIGRIAFPIFAYTVVEGFVHTHDLKKYIIRLGIFALLSEVPFDLAFAGKVIEFGHQNVFFTLFLGVVMLSLYVRARNVTEQFSVVAVTVLVSRLLHVDYQGTAILMIFLFYYLREKKLDKLFAVGTLILLVSGKIQLFSLLAFIPIALYNGERGPKMKAFFYAFYPVHLLALYLIRFL